MEKRDIEVFRAVMRAGTTSQAANLLGVSQPAVSQSLRKFELACELRLFERVRGRLVPTQEAVALMVEVDRYFTGLEMIEHRIRSLKSFGLGRLAIGSLPALGTGFMPRAIAAFGLEQRQIQLSFQVMSSREVYQQVSAGQLDFGLMAEELSVTGLEHSPFAAVYGVIVMNAQHPLARKKILDANDLASHPFIALNPEDVGRRALDEALAAEGKSLRPVIETPYSNSVCEFALQGVGMGMAHPVMALDYVARGLLLKPMTFDIPSTSLLVFRPGVPLSDNAKELLRVMRIQLDADLKRVREAVGGAVVSIPRKAPKRG